MILVISCYPQGIVAKNGGEDKTCEKEAIGSERVNKTGEEGERSEGESGAKRRRARVVRGEDRRKEKHRKY